MQEIAPHDHNGLYARKSECELHLENIEDKMKSLEDRQKASDALGTKLLWIVIGGFVGNSIVTLIARLVG